MKLKEIEAHLDKLQDEELLNQVQVYRQDSRPGVQKLCDKYLKRWQKSVDLRNEWQAKLDFDSFFHENQKIVVGIDEVGRGPLAGPVVAAAVILPYECSLLGLKDSKKLSESKREELFEAIKQQALGIGIGIVEAPVVDQINILQATFLAMRKAIEDLNKPWDILCVDGDKTIPGMDSVQHAIIKGDDKSAAIAAASVIAKVTRDRLMQNYSLQYPQYDWQSNKGYGSAKHYEAIHHYGITPLHRKTFLKNEG